MRALVHLAALLLFAGAALAGFGWLMDKRLDLSLALIALGLFAWCASTFTPPAS
jgi:hypothetical protein